jgi:hypothetical protein
MTTENQRPIIRYNNISLLKSEAPAFSEVSNSGDSISFLSNVQNLDFSFNTPDNRLETIGSRGLENHFFNPGIDIDLNISFFENFQGFFSEYFNENGLVQNIDKDINIYGIISDQIERNAIRANLTSFDMISFGNCQLDNFSMSQSVNGLIQSEYSFVCANLNAQRVSGVNSVFSGELPALDLTGSQTNEISEGVPLRFNFTGLKEKFDNQTNNTEIYPSRKTNISISGSDFLIKANSIQSFDFEVKIDKKKIYTIGKKHPIKRKTIFPLESSLSVSSLVSSFTLDEDSIDSQKNLQDLLKDNNFYNITIEAESLDGSVVTMNLPSGRLGGQSYSSSINSNLICDINFYFDAYSMDIELL